GVGGWRHGGLGAVTPVGVEDWRHCFAYMAEGIQQMLRVADAQLGVLVMWHPTAILRVAERENATREIKRRWRVYLTLLGMQMELPAMCSKHTRRPSRFLDHHKIWTES